LLTVPQLIQNRKRWLRQPASPIFRIGEAEGAIPFVSLLSEARLANSTPINVHEDFAALPYSSGTTGLPKASCLHIAIWLRCCADGDYEAFSGDDTMICVVPMYHLYGLQHRG